MNEKSYPQIQREYREHLKTHSQSGAGCVRISIQGDFTLEPLAAYIWSAAKDAGIDVAIHTGEFGQYAQEFIKPDGPLHKFSPEIVFLFFSPVLRNSFEQTIDRLENLIEIFQKNSNSMLAISNFISPCSPSFIKPEATAIEARTANEKLEEIVSRLQSAHVVDLESLAQYSGKNGVVNWKLHYMGGIDFSPEFMSLVAKRCATYLKLIKAPARKVLVLDLDNTLWGGVVGEVGTGGIKLSLNGSGSEYADFQKEINSLNKRGVLLAINSKNNYDDAIDAINNHPCMILRPDDFSAMRINWNDKASNMRELAVELNLGLESFVFLDDSPVERGIVASALPEVLVPELPEDPALRVSFLRSLDAFESLSVTVEDAARAEMYRLQKKRDTAKQQFSTVDDYLKTLNIVVKISPVNERTFARACQLILKTNQFNLTTRRYSEGEMRGFLNDPNRMILALSVSDSFGDSGLTGLAILEFCNETCRIDSMLLSCRILGRRIEDTFLAAISMAAATRTRALIGEYSPTAKNAQTRGFYERMGFSMSGEQNSVLAFSISVSDAMDKIKPCEYHQLILEGIEV